MSHYIRRSIAESLRDNAPDRPEETLRQGTLAFFRYVENRPAWSLLCAESTVAGEALEGIRAQQTDFIAELLAGMAPDASAQQTL